MGCTHFIPILTANPKILLCFFAEKRENWEAKFEIYKENFTKLISSNIKPEFTLAFPDKFVEQIKNNDAVVLYGGDDYLLQFWLGQYDLSKIWKDKVIATSSASSNAMVKEFWTCDWRQCFDGLGIIPIKFISHYKSSYGEDDTRGPIDWEKAYKELSLYGNKSLPIHALKEGEYIIIEQ